MERTQIPDTEHLDLIFIPLVISLILYCIVLFEGFFLGYEAGGDGGGWGQGRREGGEEVVGRMLDERWSLHSAPLSSFRILVSSSQGASGFALERKGR